MDRLDLIESRWREAGCGDGDKAWLIVEVRCLRGELARTQGENDLLRAFLDPIRRAYDESSSNTVGTLLVARARQPRRGWLARLRRWLRGRA